MKALLAQFYLDRALECREAAVRSPLANVRKKHTKAEASWRTMADLEFVRQKSAEPK